MNALKKPYRWCFLLVLLIGLVAPFRGAHSTKKYEPKESTRPAYLQELINPKENSENLIWLGADAATSVKITPDRYVWLFGDTILGNKEGRTRKYSVFLHNTIGVAERGQEGNFRSVKKSYKKKSGDIEAIFSSEKDHVFYWPLVGTTIESSLLVAANKVTTKNAKTFKVLGTTFFNVKNPEESPENWKYEGQYLPNEGKITWGSALVKKGDWIYVFGQKGTGLASKTVLTKIRLHQAEMGNWEKRLNFVNGEWKTGSSPTAIEGFPGTSEMTVQHNQFFGWYSLRIPPFSFDIHLYTAENLTGPWRDQGAVYTVPPPWSKKKTKKGKHVFSAYAAKSHPELAEAENEIVLTYNLNLNPFVPGLNDKLGDYIQMKKYAELYIPQFVSVEFQRTNSDC